MSWQDIRIETERLILRPPQGGDFDAYAIASADPEVRRFLGGVVERPLAWRHFLQKAGAWPIQGFSMFSVIEKSSQSWVGLLGPWYPEGWPGREVGWSLARHAWGKGYATEGAAAAMDFVFDVLGWDEVIHSIDSDNIASQKVAQRLGSCRRGSSRLPLPPPHDETLIDIWGQSRDEWHARRKREAT